MSCRPILLAPLRGVTIRTFRRAFSEQIVEAGFTEAVTPFIPANAGIDPLKDRELRLDETGGIRLTPQFIGKDPAALRHCLMRIKAAGYATADLNCGCPYPMIRKKGRGSGLLQSPDVLRALIETGCEVMGEGAFSIKARLGLSDTRELESLMPMINLYPLRFLTVHARTARQMYDGTCDDAAFRRIVDCARVPIVRNGDLTLESMHCEEEGVAGVMIGRAFIRALGSRDDAGELVRRYIDLSREELSGDRPVLGRMKELLAYWVDLPRWRSLWNVIKVCRSVEELLSVLPRERM